MDATCVFKRIEKKYLLSEAQYETLFQRIGAHLRPDEFGRSTVLSLYLDTPDRRIIRNSIEAADYKEMINDNAWNKTLEFMIMSRISHPLTAVRAVECGEWAKSDLFNRILNGIPDPVEAKPAEEAPVNDAAASPAEPQKTEPFDILGLLGLKKQDEAEPEQPAVQAAPVETEAEKELRWYRKMAEEGLITWDQYEQKRKELLGE